MRASLSCNSCVQPVYLGQSQPFNSYLPPPCCAASVKHATAGEKTAEAEPCQCLGACGRLPAGVVPDKERAGLERPVRRGWALGRDEGHCVSRWSPLVDISRDIKEGASSTQETELCDEYGFIYRMNAPSLKTPRVLFLIQGSYSVGKPVVFYIVFSIGFSLGGHLGRGQVHSRFGHGYLNSSVLKWWHVLNSEM